MNCLVSTTYIVCIWSKIEFSVYIKGYIPFVWQTYFSITQSDTYRFTWQHTPAHATQWMKLLFHPLSAASLMRSRSLSRSSANEEGRVVFPVTKSMLKVQDSGLRHRAFVELLLVAFVGRKRRETPYRHVDTVKGKSWENGAATTERLFRSCLRALGRVLSLAYTTEWCTMHCRRPPVSTPNRNSFHPFSRTCYSPPQLLARVTPSSHLFLSPSLSFRPCRFVFSTPGRISPRDHA